MSHRPDVFVSATTRDLGSYRKAVADKLLDLGLHPIVQNHFPTDHVTIARLIRDHLAPCDAVVHLAGFYYGLEPHDRPADAPRRSYTQLEHDLARELNKPVFVFLATPGCPFDKHDPEPAEVRQLQLDHRRRIEQRDDLWHSFATKEELLAKVALIQVPGHRGPVPHKPRNMPYDSLHTLFKGRDDFMQALRTALVTRPTHAAAVLAKQAIHGLGGVGKTRLAVEYALRYEADYTALLFVTADSPAALRRNLAALCAPEVLNLPEHERPEEPVRYAAVLRWLAQTPGWFLLLDNVDTDDVAQAVGQLLTQLNGHVVITSRLSDWAGVTALHLDVLDERPAADFVLERTKGKRIETAADDADALALARDVDGLALALEQAAAFIRKHSGTLAAYRERWAVGEQKVREWYDGRAMNYPRSVAATWQTSIDQLSTDGRALLNVLAWLAPEPIPVGMIRAPGGSTFDAEAGLADLATYSLVKRVDGNQSVTMHRLVQDVSRNRIATDERRGWIEQVVRMVSVFAPEYAEDVRTWGVWKLVHPHGIAVTRHADAHNIPNPTAELMGQLGLYLGERAEFAEAERLASRALEIGEATHGTHHPTVAIRLSILAQLLLATNRTTEAEPLYRRALAINEDAFGPNHSDVAISLSNLANLLTFTNRFTEAEQLYRRTLAIDEVTRSRSHPAVAVHLNNLAELLLATNRAAEAEPLYRRALAINEDAFGPNHPNIAINLSNLAGLLATTGRAAEAEMPERRALAISEAAFGPHHPTVARYLNNLAMTLRDTGRAAEAEPLLQRALAISEAIFGSHHPNVAIMLSNLARLLHETNRATEAEPLHYRAVLILHQSRQKTKHTPPNIDKALRNYRTCLTILGVSMPEIDRRIGEFLDQSG